MHILLQFYKNVVGEPADGESSFIIPIPGFGVVAQ
jgi:hypothetical protein